MVERTDSPDDPTRREYVKYGGAVITGGVLAGCASDSNSDGGDDAESTPTETEMVTATPTDDATDTPEQSYTVEMAPMGEVTFESEAMELAGVIDPSVTDRLRTVLPIETRQEDDSLPDGPSEM